jgi:hypothetical protein
MLTYCCSVRAPWSNGATTLTEVPNGTNTCFLQINNLGFSVLPTVPILVLQE